MSNKMIDPIKEWRRLNLRRIMKEEDVKPKQLAKRLGITPTCVYNWISEPTASGHRGIGKKIVEIAKILSRDPKEFDQPPPESRLSVEALIHRNVALLTKEDKKLVLDFMLRLINPPKVSICSKCNSTIR